MSCALYSVLERSISIGSRIICLLYLLATDISILLRVPRELNIAAGRSQAIASRNPWFLHPPLIEDYRPSYGGKAMHDTS